MAEAHSPRVGIWYVLGMLISFLMLAGAHRAYAFSDSTSRMDNFVTKTLNWTKEERPGLAISRGLVMAWLPDPSAFLPANPGDYYWNQSNRRIVVSPGVPLLIFPPRLDAERAANPGARISDKEYQLAVTQDGFWGIIDTFQRKSFLAEADLQRIADQEAELGPGSHFGILVGVTYQIPGPLPVTLSRGEVFRIVSDPSDRTMIDFDSDVANMRSKIADINALARNAQSAVPKQFPVDDDSAKYVDFRVTGTLVRDDLVKDWRSGSGNYSEIFHGSFSSLRWPNESQLGLSCDAKVTVKSASATEAKFAAGGGISIKADVLKYLGLHADLSAEAKTGLENNFEYAENIVPRDLENQSLIEYRDRGQPKTTYWVGTAQLCAAPAWKTLLIKTGGDKRFLHQTFYAIPDGKSPPVEQDPAQKSLDALSPGGNPWNALDATFTIRCFSQAIYLEDLLLGQMGDSSTTLTAIRTAVALSTHMKIANSPRAVGRFIGSDSGCTGSQ